MSINPSIEKANLLIEIGMEELPPKSLNQLTASLAQSLQHQLKDARLDFGTVSTHSSARRISVIIKQLDCTQADRVSERTGPTLALAYDNNDNPTKAAEGFARSCGVSVDTLEKTNTEPQKLLFQQQIKGAKTSELIQTMLDQALEQLPIAKRMRWGANEFEFVRPVHWLVALLDKQIIPCSVFGIEAGNQSQGHRFHAPDSFTIYNADSYIEQLRQAYVIADNNERETIIKKQANELADSINGSAVYDDTLLAEISALVEWPVALMGSFDESFLEMPKQVLISSMQSHQKYFPVINSSGRLMPYFITIANIESSAPEMVIRGNERVIHPRLSDAVFFYQNDLSRTLNYYADKLDSFVFERRLGSMQSKVQRIISLSNFIAQSLDEEQLIADLERAAHLCKADLLSNMVQEFPDLQGEIGGHYAQRQGENDNVSKAITEHYFPRFANDDLPTTTTGILLSLADRFDTLTGIFAIGKQPTGSRDPFALRRHSFAIIRMIIETNLALDLKLLVDNSIKQFDYINADSAVISDNIIKYLLERMRSYCDELNIDGDIFRAVNALNITKPIDFIARCNALMAFKTMPEANDLSQAHKRVNNILKKNADALTSDNIDESALVDAAEQQLYIAIQQLQSTNQQQNDYNTVLKATATINNRVNHFFEEVMVMSDDPILKNNRLILLSLLNQQLSLVADIAELD